MNLIYYGGGRRPASGGWLIYLLPLLLQLQRRWICWAMAMMAASEVR